MDVLNLTVHSWLRWVAIIVGLRATYAASQASGNDAAERWGLRFMMVLDLQMLLGLALYFVLSDVAAEAFKDFGAAMRNPLQRFWAVEHITLMVLAVVLVHVGRVMARKARTPESSRARKLVFFGLATLAILLGIPWPGLRYGRPLLPPFF
jgi:hypothetical protein